MRTVTETYTIYKYNELSDDAKQKVKNWYLDDPCRVEFFQDDIMHDLGVLFNHENHCMEVQFGLGYCQGDGVNIYGSVSVIEVIDFLKNNNRYENPLSEEEIKTILLYAEDTDGIGLPYNRHYSYCMADYIEFAGDWIDQLEWAIEEGYAAVDDIDKELIEKFENIVKNIFSNLCKEYEKWGYEYFYEVSDAEMQELCEANELEFYEDGKFYC